MCSGRGVYVSVYVLVYICMGMCLYMYCVFVSIYCMFVVCVCFLIIDHQVLKGYHSTFEISCNGIYRCLGGWGQPPAAQASEGIHCVGTHYDFLFEGLRKMSLTFSWWSFSLFFSSLHCVFYIFLSLSKNVSAVSLDDFLLLLTLLCSSPNSLILMFPL